MTLHVYAARDTSRNRPEGGPMTPIQRLGLRVGLLLDRLPRRKRKPEPQPRIIITGNLVVNATDGTLDPAALADAIREAANRPRGRA